MSNLVTDHHDFWHGLRRDFARQTRDVARRGERKPPFPIEWLLDPPKPTLLEQAIIGWDWSLKPRSKHTRQITRIMDAATGAAWSPANTDQAACRLLRGTPAPAVPVVGAVGGRPRKEPVRGDKFGESTQEGLKLLTNYKQADQWQAEGRNLARELRGLPPLPVNKAPAWVMIATAAVATIALSAFLLGKAKAAV